MSTEVRQFFATRGNLTSDGTRTFTYDVENRLLTGTAPTAVTLTYDPSGRLQTSTASSSTTTFLYDGSNLSAEYGSGTVLRRYVPSGLGVDSPLLWYEGSATGPPRWLHTDNQGSIIAYSDTSGNNDDIYGYDPFGLPDATNGWSASPHYRYTGEITIPQASLYYYKARVYDPNLGRFLQTDPIRYDSNINSYVYAANSPTNGTDPSGLSYDCSAGAPCPVSDLVVIAHLGTCGTCSIGPALTQAISEVFIPLNPSVSPVVFQSTPQFNPAQQMSRVLEKQSKPLDCFFYAVRTTAGLIGGGIRFSATGNPRFFAYTAINNSALGKAAGLPPLADDFVGTILDKAADTMTRGLGC